MKPLELLEQHRHKRVLVSLRGGRSVSGVLDGFDQHLNLVLSGSEETSADGTTARSALTLLRGDSIVYISP